MSFIIPEFTTSIIDTGFTPEDEDTKKLYREVTAFAKQGQPIVIFGPAGSGKEFLARHYYSTLIKSPFYTQYRNNWPAKYNSLKAQYSAHYSGKSLDIFLSSLKPGIFQSINSASVYPNLAESIFFGQEENISTGAATKPGLLEVIKGGILYIEEIEELPPDLQAKLLRAFNPEISRGSRIFGRMDYPLDDLIIITATNQPYEKVRKDFYYRMSIQVIIKSMDERPNDIRKSIPYFIIKAIDKRKDKSAISKVFGINLSGIQNRFSETDDVKSFADDLAEKVADEIIMRKWPGNFRALRTAVEASVLRIDKLKDITTFSEDLHKNLHHYIKQYSEGKSKTSVGTEGPSRGKVVYPSRYPDMDRKILERINSRGRFKDMSDFEKKILAVFLSETHETGFSRKDLEDQYKSYTEIRHTSEAHIRGKIKKLLELSILEKTGEGKSTWYSLTDFFLDQVKNDDAFALPDIDKNWADRTGEIGKLVNLFPKTERIYIMAPERFGKSAFMALFCHAMKQTFNLYYYELGQEGIRKLFEDIYRILQSMQIKPDQNKFLKNPVNTIHTFLPKVFREKNGEKPVLILDNAHFVSEPDHISTLTDLSKKWKEVILILVGEKIDNRLTDFTEFRLDPWGKQA
jgi:DNA-binding NtrC family response regulator